MGLLTNPAGYNQAAVSDVRLAIVIEIMQEEGDVVDRVHANFSYFIMV